MFRPINTFLFLLLFCCEAKAQNNLIPNSSFEEYFTCPITYAQLNGVCKSWFDPTNCSTDYYNNCSLTVGTPDNGMGHQAPYHGESYVGFYAYYKLMNNYRESIGVKLLQTLEKDKKYCFSMYISLADSVCYAVKKIDVSFSNDIYSDTICNFLPLNIIPALTFNSNHFYTDKANWIKLEGSFIANGNENYIYISNLNNQIDTLQLNLNSLNDDYNGAYYYVDFLTLEDCNKINEIEIANIFTPNNDGFNDVWQVDLRNFSNVNCTVFNRWGNKIYQTSNRIIIWSGTTTSGEECIDGTYFYTIETENKTYRGYLQLMR